eukprot:CAMPEP_0116139004 /NCGR_PEP_ID=MMETSP0329-20121206/13074_1 /TAXON_ID=697910 /ORGANISM="Pseudo-nitzschia arenysensis, Strain B593" /LENGTH=1448 /DNA_ID=CAMNT_0003634005 /DNA_START=438 /DNA_END=4784 /DNA_ORIENTATION=-
MLSCTGYGYGESRNSTPEKGGTGNKHSSPLSIIEQWQRDAKGAVEDAYANFVLGDDTGESARLVLVASPSDDIKLLDNTGNGKHPPHILLNDPHTKGSSKRDRNGKHETARNMHNNNNNNNNNNNANNNNLLLFSHMDFYTDANRNSLMGQQRNSKYKKHDPHASSFMSCGVTFVEINGRAYVHALDEESAAYRSGVRPRDCVQYAAVLAKEWEDPMGGDFDPISTQALEREDKGQRITYEELKRVFLQGSGILGDLNQDTDASYGYGYGEEADALGPPGMNPPPLPTTIRIGKNPCGVLLNQKDDVDDDGSTVLSTRGNTKSGNSKDKNGLEDPRPVVLVFRRTRQRPTKAWNVWPNYRLDDECDVACQILESLTTTVSASRNVPSSPPRSPHKRQQDDETATSTIWDDGSTFADDPSHISSKRGGGGDKVNRILFSTDDHGGFEEANRKDFEENDNVEASTIRGMIAKAVGLAFVRSNKVVLGVSFHGGSGIVLSRLSDGTWSSPSLIGMAGMGLGLQVGLEVANYIFILQTEEALEHFSRGGSFTLGANVGAAFAGMGREAVGAASVSPALCGIAHPIQAIKEDEYYFENDEGDDYEIIMENGKPASRRFRSRGVSCAGTSACRPQADRGPTTIGECTSGALEGNGGLAPIVAYAKSEGLYVGVSLEGSRIFARDEANAKAYKYSSYNHKAVTARDILTGKIVSRPPEAEALYAFLHDIELTHEWSSLPNIPSASWLNDWSRPWDANVPAYSLSTDSNDEPESDMEEYANKFRDLLFGGITVTRISPRNHKREKRSLWLSSPAPTEANDPNSGRKNSSSTNEVERGSLKVGFVSKLYSATAQRKHLSASIINDVQTSSKSDNAEAAAEMGDELTLDSALMDNQSLLTTTGTLQERVELSKKLSVNLVDVMTLAQLTPPNVRLADPSERDRIICIECSNDTQLVFLGNSVEETKLLYCGLKILLEKETSRLGVRGSRPTRSGRRITSALRSKNGKSSSSTSSSKHRKMGGSTTSLGYASSDVDDTDDYDPSEHSHGNIDSTISARYPLPEGWRSWGRVPGRSYMRAQSTSTDDGYPTYAHGQLLVRDICKTVQLPLPLPLCRVLLLDSSSPVISKWETDRGDSDFERTPWTFPPATPREMEQFQSEHQLIASGSMCGAHRTISYERYRNGKPARLSETHIVDSDDSEKLAFQVSERLPRRGFSIKVKILLRAIDNGSACEATVLGEIRPVGKNMSDPAAVHKALLKVSDELRYRYGSEYVGLLAGFLNVIENMPKDEALRVQTSSGVGAHSSSWRNGWEEKKEADNAPRKKILEKTSVVKFEDVMNAELGINDMPDSRFGTECRPSNATADDYKKKPMPKLAPENDTFANSSLDPVTIEVKPLPKIRLSLMPSPREEDEEDLDEDGEPKSKSKSKSRSSHSSRKSSRSKSKRSPFGKKSKKKTSSS